MKWSNNKFWISFTQSVKMLYTLCNSTLSSISLKTQNAASSSFKKSLLFEFSYR